MKKLRETEEKYINASELSNEELLDAVLNMKATTRESIDSLIDEAYKRKIMRQDLIFICHIEAYYTHKIANYSPKYHVNTETLEIEEFK